MISIFPHLAKSIGVPFGISYLLRGNNSRNEIDYFVAIYFRHFFEMRQRS